MRPQHAVDSTLIMPLDARANPHIVCRVALELHVRLPHVVDFGLCFVESAFTCSPNFSARSAERRHIPKLLILQFLGLLWIPFILTQYCLISCELNYLLQPYSQFASASSPLFSKLNLGIVVCRCAKYLYPFVL